MKAILRILALSALVLALGGLARATSLNYSISGYNTSSNNPGISIPTNAVMNTFISISTSSGIYTGSAGAILTFPHAPNSIVHALNLTAPYVSGSWTDYLTPDTYQLVEFCSMPNWASGSVSVTISW